MGLKKAGGAFAFASGMLGYYAVANLMCQATFFGVFQWGIRAGSLVRTRLVRGKSSDVGAPRICSGRHWHGDLG